MNWRYLRSTILLGAALVGLLTASRALDADDDRIYRLDSRHGFARDDRAPSVFAMAQPQLARSLKVALCWADNGLGRICRLQLVIGKLGIRSHQRADAMYRSLGTVDLSQ